MAHAVLVFEGPQAADLYRQCSRLLKHAVTEEQHERFPSLRRLPRPSPT